MECLGYNRPSPQEQPAEQPPEVNKRNLLFCGNPGAGKSTLLNSIVGRVAFKSGVSVGQGLTFKYESVECSDGLTYMDTPGLADLKLRKQAADAIVEALRVGGWYRVVFVVTLEAGRFKPDDLTTMRLVLGASEDIIDYGLIINKVSTKVAKKLADDEHKNALLDLVFSDPNIPRTNHMYVNDFQEQLNDENDVYVPAKTELKQFIQNIKDSYVIASQVQNLEIDKFEELQEQAAERQTEILAQKAEIDAHKAALEEAQRALTEKNLEMEEERQRSAAGKEIAAAQLAAQHGKANKNAEEAAAALAEENKAKLEAEKKAQASREAKLEAEKKAQASRRAYAKLAQEQKAKIEAENAAQVTEQQTRAANKIIENLAAQKKTADAATAEAEKKADAYKKAYEDVLVAERRAAEQKRQAVEKLQREKQQLEQQKQIELEQQAREKHTMYERFMRRLNEEKEKNEAFRRRIQATRDQEMATREAARRTNVFMSRYGVELNCNVVAKTMLFYEMDGSFCAEKGTRGTIKGHALNADRDGHARASVDWSNGKTSVTRYIDLERAPQTRIFCFR